MTTAGNAGSTDLIRWTFVVPGEAVAAIEAHLSDLGADVFIRDEQTFHVTWEEPEMNLDPVVESIWGIVGTPFEITQEEFHRLDLQILHHEDDTAAEVAEPPRAQSDPDAFHPGFDSLDIREL